MTDKKTQTAPKTRTVVWITVGVVAFVIVMFLVIYFQNLINDYFGDRTLVSYNGLVDKVELSSDSLVTAADQKIVGKPVVYKTDPKTGSDSPEVTIVQYGSFSSGYSAAAKDILNQILAKHGDSVQLVWKDYYANDDDLARMGALAAHCAGRQDMFWEMHNKIFSTEGGYNLTDLMGFASDLKLDTDAFALCLEDDDIDAQINKNISQAVQMNISGIPIFFIGQAEPLEGIVTFSKFDAIVRQELGE
ncbi:thioredoxin domain-containing protein [Patescibacteria group bacterium]|nr:thioredoxin domain-containing protein [Patescibacteria group bacterium]MBU1890537.1 thioredoxin domain-containing protein [Patescibacteria group bacterium]